MTDQQLNEKRFYSYISNLEDDSQKMETILQVKLTHYDKDENSIML